MILRLQCGFTLDSAFPRDRVYINPHFSAAQLTQAVDGDALCEDLATALDTWSTPDCEVTVRAYDAQGTPPVRPIGSAVRSLGVVGASGMPREVALCLSFFAGQNEPRKRGRCYVPGGLTTTTSASIRPTVNSMNKVADLVNIFRTLGGADIDWVVYSRADDQARAVTNWWVDNEWDIQRSRGGRATSRIGDVTSA